MKLGSFDFTVLIQFLAALFNTFATLAEKLGFKLDMSGITGNTEAGSSTEAAAAN